jgi:hypothetical protein
MHALAAVSTRFWQTHMADKALHQQYVEVHKLTLIRRHGRVVGRIAFDS